MTIFKASPNRLTIHEFTQHNGGLEAALKVFAQLLAADYHPTLITGNNDFQEQPITLIELISPELNAFQSQQLADTERWGTPLTYFEFARLNRGTAIEITAADSEYMLCAMPPVYGRGCFAMGEIYTHTNAGIPIYYWSAKQNEKYFCLLGTQAEAENQFGPTKTIVGRDDVSLLQKLINRDDVDSETTEVLERLTHICSHIAPSAETTDPWQHNETQFPRLIAEIQATGVIDEETLAALCESMDLEPHQLNELFARAEEQWELTEGNTDHARQLTKNRPSISWTKPLTACGPDDDPLIKLHGTVEIAGVSFHAEAFEVSYTSDDHQQVGRQSEDETYLAEICNIVQGAAETISIAGREYVFAIMPGQR